MNIYKAIKNERHTRGMWGGYDPYSNGEIRYFSTLEKAKEFVGKEGETIFTDSKSINKIEIIEVDK